ncbi:hypothetical protein LTR56_016211 [Elasticomyces elasticus]|nr:hypothetical protein LTR56_016211 [Elasticomyces elasticus]KAK4914218.1 hypothetical protein LTR49_017571 [Elasticomyces elasticus]KAK5762579.1 hypothetical protein LTS12_007370 [Elasticomyces elasticus]
MDKTEKSDPTLLGLPVELQTQIAEWLLVDTDPEGRNAILHLRTACRDFYAVCASKTTLLKKRSTKLYLHPTRLLDVLAVCKQVDLAADITELVVLGRSTVGMFPSQDDDRESTMTTLTWTIATTIDLGHSFSHRYLRMPQNDRTQSWKRSMSEETVSWRTIKA